MQVNHVSQGLGAPVHHADVSAYGHVAVIRGRRRELAREIVRHWVDMSTEVGVKRPARLETRFLIGRQPILVSEADRRSSLVLAVPVLRGLTRMIVELHRRLLSLIPLIG